MTLETPPLRPVEEEELSIFLPLVPEIADKLTFRILDAGVISTLDPETGEPSVLMDLFSMNMRAVKVAGPAGILVGLLENIAGVARERYHAEKRARRG